MLIFESIYIPNWLLLTALVAFLIHRHYKKNFTFWESQGVPGPRPWPLIGHLNVAIGSKPYHQVENGFFKKYGKIYGRYEYSTKILTVNDPELLKQILVKDFDVFRNRRNFGTTDELFARNLLFQEDDAWKNSRKVLSPAFSLSKVKQMSDLINECTDDLVALLVKKAETKETFECRKIFFVYAAHVIARCIFGIEIDGQNPDGKFVKNAKQVVEPDFSWRFILFFLCPTIMNVFKISIFEPKLIDYFSKILSEVFKARKNTASSKVDLVQILLEYMEKNPEDKAGKDDSMVFTEKDMLIQAITFLFGGLDPPAAALTFAAYNLAIYPDCQKVLLEEVDKTLEKHGQLDYEAVQDMPYLAAVIDETLRLYPAIIHGERVCSQDYTLGSISFPKGTVVSFSQYSIHRDPDYWQNPDTFDPERFLGDNAKDHHPGSYLPFVIGPRNCIAQRFALMEIKFGLAQILRKVKFVKSPKTQVPLKFKSGIDGLAPESVDIQVELRE